MGIPCNLYQKSIGKIAKILSGENFGRHPKFDENVRHGFKVNTLQIKHKLGSMYLICSVYLYGILKPCLRSVDKFFQRNFWHLR